MIASDSLYNLHIAMGKFTVHMATRGTATITDDGDLLENGEPSRFAFGKVTAFRYYGGKGQIQWWGEWQKVAKKG